MMIALSASVLAQEPILNLMKKEKVLADEYFENGNFPEALNIYLRIGKSKPSADLDVHIARCYFFLKKYHQSADYYTRSAEKRKLPTDDLLKYAEVSVSAGNIENGIAIFRKYLNDQPGDELILKKIWRLSNLKFLYEDSAHYSLSPLSLNTNHGEMCGIPFQDGIVFISNRREPEPIEKTDGSSGSPFYKIYLSKGRYDSVYHTSEIIYKEPHVLNYGLPNSRHAGPVVFYNGFSKVVFTASSQNHPPLNKSRMLQLFLAEVKNGKLINVNAFPYNSEVYSTTDPAISSDGNTLYFSSDMPGGYGGRDLYKSELIDGEWTGPVNLGADVNTSYDEVFPYLHQNTTLYFSSNGHAGMGGLDIFSTQISENGFSEILNLGYPVNSSYDDFGLTLDSLKTHGYLSSNRANGGFDDDLYEVNIDMQTYPLVVHGVIRYKEQDWNDSSEIKIYANAKLYLIDHLRNTVVAETESDADGKFSMVIPQYSIYRIKVTDGLQEEGMVSLEIPKHRKDSFEYDMVVVKDSFKKTNTQLLK
jgi:tetratricopeptide (TPR) repeat protein